MQEKPKPRPLRMASNLLLNLNTKTQSWDVPKEGTVKEENNNNNNNEKE